eukprot:6197704-Pleurochrysis_carterae.AAC.3
MLRRAAPRGDRVEEVHQRAERALWVDLGHLCARARTHIRTYARTYARTQTHPRRQTRCPRPAQGWLASANATELCPMKGVRTHSSRAQRSCRERCAWCEHCARCGVVRVVRTVRIMCSVRVVRVVRGGLCASCAYCVLRARASRTA